MSRTRSSAKVETLEDKDVGGLDLLGGVEHAGDVVVDGLVDRLALHESLGLLVHEVCRGDGEGGLVS